MKTAKAETFFGKVADVTHPLFQRYAKEIDPLLSVLSVYRYWTLKPPVGTRVLLNFTDQCPRCWSGPSRAPGPGGSCSGPPRWPARARPTDRGAWNEFPSPAANNWAFLALMNETIPYLAGTTNEQLNFEAGENVLLSLGPGARFQNFRVTGPDTKTTESLAPSASSDVLEIVAPQMLGQWTVMAKDAEKQQTQFGFSLNPPRTESQFSPLETQRPRRNLRQGRLCPGRGRQDAPDGCREDQGRHRALPLADDVDHDHRDAGEPSGQHLLQGSGAAVPGKRDSVTLLS